MKRHPLLGVLTVLAGLVPLRMAFGFVWGFGAPPLNWIVLQYAVPGATAVIAGLLLCIKHRWQYVLGAMAWALMTAVASFSFVLGLHSHRHSMFAYPIGMGVVEACYVVAGLVICAFLIRQSFSATAVRTSIPTNAV